VSRYQKGKTDVDFTEARDSEWRWHQLGHMLVCVLLQADNHVSTPPLSFLQAGCPSCRPTNSVSNCKLCRYFCLGYPLYRPSEAICFQPVRLCVRVYVHGCVQLCMHAGLGILPLACRRILWGPFTYYVMQKSYFLDHPPTLCNTIQHFSNPPPMLYKKLK